MLTIRTVLPLMLLALLVGRPSSADPGIRLLAHGGSAEWNGRVTELVVRVNATRPTEVAFGMATRANIHSAIDKLVARGVTEIVAVPLFVSSWSTVITSTEYLLGCESTRLHSTGEPRQDEPRALRDLEHRRIWTRGPRRDTAQRRSNLFCQCG